MATEVFDSSKIPTEIEDMLIVSTDTLKADPNLGKALAGIWYETMALMSRNDSQGQAARASMAALSGATPAGYDNQLKTTYLYSDPRAALAFTEGADLIAATDKVRTFSFSAGLFGQGAKSVDDIGISFPGGKVLGSAQNVKLRFVSTYVAAAAAGKL